MLCLYDAEVTRDGTVDILEDAWTKGYRRMMRIVQAEEGREDCGAGWVRGRPP